MRARAQIEEKESSGRSQIVVTEIPYQVNKENLVKAIAELAMEKKIEGISGVHDESDKDGMRIVIELKRDAIPNVVLNQLYKHTAMQSTFGVIMLALDKGAPKVMNLKELLEHYIEHRHEIIVRRTQFDLDAAQAREHILEGLKIAVDNIDEVIKIIRGSEDTPEADARLRKRFELTEKQSEAILNMRLAKLTGLEIDKLEAELKEVRATIKELKAILASQAQADGDPQGGDGRGRRAVRRRPPHRDHGRPGRVHDRGPDRRRGHGHHHLPLRLHQADPGLAPTGGSGAAAGGSTAPTSRTTTGSSTSSSPAPTTTCCSSPTPGSSTGSRCTRSRRRGRAARGKPVVNCIAIKPDEQIAALVPVREFADDKCLLFATRQGTVKKTLLSAYGNVRTNGINAINIEKGDELIDVQVCDRNNDIVLATRDGMSIRFHESDVREMGRATTGVKGIELREGRRGHRHGGRPARRHAAGGEREGLRQALRARPTTGCRSAAARASSPSRRPRRPVRSWRSRR